MKKVSIKQIIAGGLASTIFVTSCTKDALFIEERNVEKINNNRSNLLKSNYVNVLPINYSSEEFEYFNFLNQLAEDIINNKDVARQFSNNPNDYLVKNGYGHIKINLEESMLKFILALANDEIINAIENNDIQAFLFLMKKYNLDTIINNSDIERVVKLINENPELKNLNGLEKTSVVAFAVAVVVGAVVAVWAVAVTHAVTVNVAAAATVFAAIWAVKGKDDVQPKFIGNEYIIKLWNIKNKENSTYILIDEYKKQKIKELINGIKSSYPEVFNKVEEETLKQLLSLNI